MPEISLWFFSCDKCGKRFPIIQEKYCFTEEVYEIQRLEQAKKKVKFCPYCGSGNIKLIHDYPQYFG